MVLLVLVLVLVIVFGGATPGLGLAPGPVFITDRAVALSAGGGKKDGGGLRGGPSPGPLAVADVGAGVGPCDCEFPPLGV